MVTSGNAVTIWIADVLLKQQACSSKMKMTQSHAGLEWHEGKFYFWLNKLKARDVTPGYEPGSLNSLYCWFCCIFWIIVPLTTKPQGTCAVHHFSLWYFPVLISIQLLLYVKFAYHVQKKNPKTTGFYKHLFCKPFYIVSQINMHFSQPQFLLCTYMFNGGLLLWIDA